eukprot:CAMPEP_0119325074 /NCGR_PEP_ID=MMETSP1333-20130426/64917_1 /TAXON_ID=418940 /ORGANISM="Scyphosphaera apsteinii, Strain RCC1455" /LENGTH=194 /DNA_ID=CAMNT_0007332951 /DNA_START=15 /DNA_END=599 /DNA_ORIENTATION=+
MSRGLRLLSALKESSCRVKVSMKSVFCQPRLFHQPLSSSASGFEYMVQRSDDVNVRDIRDLPERSKRQRKPQSGVLSVQNSWNNTIITISDMDYKTKGWVSGGSVGFKGSKRASFFAMEKCMSEAFIKARQLGMRRLMINMTGPAIVLRKPLLRQLREQSKMRIMKLRMSDSVPHGGCRPRKSRRRRYKTRARR